MDDDAEADNAITGLADRICVLEEQRTALTIAVIALARALSPEARARVMTELRALQGDMAAKEQANGASFLQTLVTVIEDRQQPEEGPLQ